MLSRSEIERRLASLSGDLSQRNDAVWACARREREALEMALQLAEWVEAFAATKPRDSMAQLNTALHRKDAARAWLDGKDTP